VLCVSSLQLTELNLGGAVCAGGHSKHTFFSADTGRGCVLCVSLLSANRAHFGWCSVRSVGTL